MFYQVENSENINKIYAPDSSGIYPSGAGAIPYTWGWANKYSPKPFGLRVRPSLYSTLANPHIIHSSGYLEHYYNDRIGFDDKLSSRLLTGPVNGIYEVEVSGIRTKVGGSGCIKGEVLNQKYLLYYIDNYNISALGNPPVAAGQNEDSSVFYSAIGQVADNAYWFGRTCNKNTPVNICGIDGLILSLDISSTSKFNDIADGVTYNSGIVNLNFKMLTNLRLGQNLLTSTNNSGYIEFRKSFGYINTSDPRYNISKPSMMDTEYTLHPVSSGNFSYSYPDNFGDTSLGDYDVDLSNAIALIRPYKSQFYDVKNADRNFYSGEYFPVYTNAEALGVKPDGYYYRNNIYIFSPVQELYSASGQYHTHYTSGNKLFGASSGTPLDAFFPYNFSISFNDVVEFSGVKRQNCINCQDFYGKKKNLYLRTDNAGPKYIWRGFSEIEDNPITGRQFYDLNYYNICDCACNRDSQVGSPALNLEQGPCNNFIEFSFFESGTDVFTVGNTGSALIAYILFGGIFSSGISGSNINITGYSRKRLSKTLCWNASSGNQCFPIRDFSGIPIPFTSSGCVDLFDYSVWSSGWKIEDHNFSNPITTYPFRSIIFQSGSPLDITNYCDFSSGNILIEPPIHPQFPCMGPRCTICDGRYVPQSCNLDFARATYTSGSVDSGDDFSYILSSLDTQSSYGVKNNCDWRYYDSSGNISVDLSYDYLASGLNYFLFTWNSGGSITPVTFYGTVNSTGGAVDFRINCNDSINGSFILGNSGDVPNNTGIDKLPGSGCFTAYNLTANLTDLYDILDYI